MDTLSKFGKGVLFHQWVLEELRKEGVRVDDRIERHDFGKFGWIMDSEGNRIELREPADPPSSKE